MLANRKVTSPAPEVTSTSESQSQSQQSRVSKTENVVEISSSKESTVEGIKDVVVNLPSSGTKLNTISTLPGLSQKTIPSAQSLTEQVSNVLASASKSVKTAVKNPLVLAHKLNTSAVSRSGNTSVVPRPIPVSTSKTSETVKAKDTPSLKQPFVIDISNSPELPKRPIEIIDSPTVKKPGITTNSPASSGTRQIPGSKTTSPVAGQLSPVPNTVSVSVIVFVFDVITKYGV